jgi:hypothetical protein
MPLFAILVLLALVLLLHWRQQQQWGRRHWPLRPGIHGGHNSKQGLLLLLLLPPRLGGCMRRAQDEPQRH